MHTDRLQTIRRYSSGSEAKLAESVLRQQGINCIVTGESDLGAYGSVLYQVELRISENDAEVANAVLTDIEELQADHDAGAVGRAAEFDWVCENCAERSPMSFANCWSCDAPVTPDATRMPADQLPAHEEIVDSTTIDREWAQDDESPFRPPAIETITFRMTKHHDLVNRAMRCTTLALLFPPMAVYAIYLIRKCLIAGQPPRRIYAALFVCLLLLSLTCLFLTQFIR